MHACDRLTDGVRRTKGQTDGIAVARALAYNAVASMDSVALSQSSLAPLDMVWSHLCRQIRWLKCRKWTIFLIPLLFRLKFVVFPLE